MVALNCRFCASKLTETVVDLGASPLANSYVSPERIMDLEPFFSLHAFVCSSCFLVQVPTMTAREKHFR